MTIRNRVSLSLSGVEFEQIKSVSMIMGTTPTNVVYEAYRLGLNQLLSEHQKRGFNICIALDSLQRETVKPSKPDQSKKVFPKNKKKRKR